jgi:isoamylase
LIAEAWDAAGLYQVGSFPGYRWGEWNGRYRDVIRRFVRGDTGMISEVATRISGSSDLYEHQGRLPISSINFVTCHDGFTLHDLFSYNEKQNMVNGENNQDGSNENYSFNCGVEGETENNSILQLRKKQAKNVFAILLLSQGVPMLLAGDEFLNSQMGNNNAYCQDNGLSWLDWGIAAQNADIVHFVQQMIALRKRHPSVMRRRFLTGKDIRWHGIQVDQPQWDKPETRVLAYTLAGTHEDEADLHIVMNMSDEKVTVDLPAISGKEWCVAVDTSLPSFQEIIAPQRQNLVSNQSYFINSKTIVVLENRDSNSKLLHE